MRLSVKKVQSELVLKIGEISGEKILGCYQCGKCSAGCPMAALMDVAPHQVLRLVQLGSPEEAERCRAIWLCASCHTCASRCPRGVDLSRVMEALRVVLLRSGAPFVDLSKIPAEVLNKVPQQALVGGLRKYTG
jgi:heterodisulfide reductase subunit C